MKRTLKLTISLLEREILFIELKKEILEQNLILLKESLKQKRIIQSKEHTSNLTNELQEKEEFLKSLEN